MNPLDLHLDPDVPDGVPYQCPTCRGIAWTRRSRPECLGNSTGSHAPAEMERVDERDAEPGSTPGLHLR